MEPESLRIALILREEASVWEPHMCLFGRKMNERDVYGFPCKLNTGQYPAYVTLNDIFKYDLHSAGVLSILAPIEIVTVNIKRQDGISVLAFSRGRRL